jgi:hypothetical protein
MLSEFQKENLCINIVYINNQTLVNKFILLRLLLSCYPVHSINKVYQSFKRFFFGLKLTKYTMALNICFIFVSLFCVFTTVNCRFVLYDSDNPDTIVDNGSQFASVMKMLATLFSRLNALDDKGKILFS